MATLCLSHSFIFMEINVGKKTSPGKYMYSLNAKMQYEPVSLVFSQRLKKQFEAM